MTHDSETQTRASQEVAATPAPGGAGVSTDRPRLHFTPARNWMNDPNGLVFHRGLYHLYFQYNPYGRNHANMSWGHATSPDLVHWTEHEVAIAHDEAGAIFSGSIVVDEANTSGLGEPGKPALVALYTLAAPGRQAQALAFSLDDGYTWTKYAGNPVLDRGSADFRDPKVFWFDGESESYWVMVAVEAQDRQVLFYRSEDLIHWSHLSSYGPAGAVGGVWECPDLFPLPLDGDDGDQRWVLLISLSPGSLAGGSGTQYVVGHFDGTAFRPDRPPAATRRISGGSFAAGSLCGSSAASTHELSVPPGGVSAADRGGYEGGEEESPGPRPPLMSPVSPRNGTGRKR